MIDGVCVECSYNGPHAVVSDEDPERHVVVVECPECHALFEVNVN